MACECVDKQWDRSMVLHHDSCYIPQSEILSAYPPHRSRHRTTRIVSTPRYPIPFHLIPTHVQACGKVCNGRVCHPNCRPSKSCCFPNSYRNFFFGGITIRTAPPPPDPTPYPRRTHSGRSSSKAPCTSIKPQAMFHGYGPARTFLGP